MPHFCELCMVPTINASHPELITCSGKRVNLTRPRKKTKGSTTYELAAYRTVIELSAKVLDEILTVPCVPFSSRFDICKRRFKTLCRRAKRVGPRSLTTSELCSFTAECRFLFCFVSGAIKLAKSQPKLVVEGARRSQKPPLLTNRAILALPILEQALLYFAGITRGSDSD